MVTRVLGVVSTLIMARILVPADFGLMAMASTFAAAIDAMFQFGIQDALIRRQESDERLHDTAFTLQLLRSVLTGLGVVLGAPFAAQWFGEPRLVPIMLVLALGAMVSGMQNIGVVAFRRDIDYGRQFLFLCIPRLVQVVVTITCAVTLRSYWALVVGVVVSKVMQAVLSYIVHPYRPRLSLRHWRDLASFSAWTWAASLASIVWNRCDPFVIGPVVGAARLGVFLLASEVACLPVSELIAPASEVLLGGFSLSQRQGGNPVSTAIPAAMTLLFMVMPLMIAMSATSGLIVSALLGPSWTEAGPLVAVSVWLGLFSPFSFVCGTALVSANRVRLNFVANGIASAIKLSGLLLTVWVTADLLDIMLASMAIIGLEAAVFIAALARAGEPAWRDSLPSVARLLCSATATLLLAWSSGLGWHEALVPSGWALLTGGLFGAAIVAVFAAVTWLLWRSAGRPEGPETRLGSALRRLGGSFAGAASHRLASLLRSVAA